MKLDITKLPKKSSELNLFKKLDKGCILYGYSQKNKDIVVSALIEDFEIEKDFCIDEKTMDMIKELNGDIEIGQDIVIKASKKKYKAKLIESLFMLPKTDYSKSLVVNVDNLKIASTFVSQNTTRPILTGVNINENLNIYATDSFAAYRHAESDMPDSTQSITIPKDFISLISNEFTGKVTIYYNNNSCMLEKDNIKYISNLLNGNYPSMAKLFKYGGTHLEFDRKDFADELALAKKVGYSKTEKDTYITCCLATNTFTANGENDFECEMVNTGDNIEYKVYMSMRLLENVVKNLKNDKIDIYYGNEYRPLLINETANDYLILPIRKEE